MDNNASRGDSGDASNPPPFLNWQMEVEMSKRHLPHWQLDGGLYFVTWRLADSLPQSLLREWMIEKQIWLKQHPRPWDTLTQEAYRDQFPRRMEAWLDAGYGASVLRDPGYASFVAETMHHFDGERYDLASYVIMPNHVHVLFQLRGQTRLERVLGTWKGYAARQINKRRGQTGALWQPEYHDTSIRSLLHLKRCYAYILENPTKARLQAGEFMYYESPGLRTKLDLDPD